MALLISAPVLRCMLLPSISSTLSPTATWLGAFGFKANSQFTVMSLRVQGQFVVYGWEPSGSRPIRTFKTCDQKTFDHNLTDAQAFRGRAQCTGPRIHIEASDFHVLGFRVGCSAKVRGSIKASDFQVLGFRV